MFVWAKHVFLCYMLDLLFLLSLCPSPLVLRIHTYMYLSSFSFFSFLILLFDLLTTFFQICLPRLAWEIRLLQYEFCSFLLSVGILAGTLFCTNLACWHLLHWPSSTPLSPASALCPRGFFPGLVSSQSNTFWGHYWHVLNFFSELLFLPTPGSQDNPSFPLVLPHPELHLYWVLFLVLGVRLCFELLDNLWIEQSLEDLASENGKPMNAAQTLPHAGV